MSFWGKLGEAAGGWAITGALAGHYLVDKDADSEAATVSADDQRHRRRGRSARRFRSRKCDTDREAPAFPMLFLDHYSVR